MVDHELKIIKKEKTNTNIYCLRFIYLLVLIWALKMEIINSPKF